MRMGSARYRRIHMPLGLYQDIKPTLKSTALPWMRFVGKLSAS